MLDVEANVSVPVPPPVYAAAIENGLLAPVMRTGAETAMFVTARQVAGDATSRCPVAPGWTRSCAADVNVAEAAIVVVPAAVWS